MYNGGACVLQDADTLRAIDTESRQPVSYARGEYVRTQEGVNGGEATARRRMRTWVVISAIQSVSRRTTAEEEYLGTLLMTDQDEDGISARG